MAVCVLDTDVVIAALDRADANHPAAAASGDDVQTAGPRHHSLADGFAVATAERLEGDLASFDRRVRRALEEVGPRLSPVLSD